MACNGINYSKR